MSDPIDQLSDQDIERYARQLVLPEIGSAGQLALKDAHMAIIGCGGLGANAALALAQAGVGKLSLFDPDQVDMTNLHRQPFELSHIGMAKTQALGHLCHARNPGLQIELSQAAFETSNAPIWLDCTDTYASRSAIANLRPMGTTLVFGSVISMDAQVSVFDDTTKPFTDFFPAPSSQRDTCADMGVLGPLAVMTAQIMATEAMKTAMGTGASLRGKLLMIDARDWRQTLVSLSS